MTEYSHELKIPKERIAVVIGPKGSMKKELEELSKSKLHIDSETGDIRITGEDPILLYSIREVVKAISRGFNPDVAKMLMKQDYCLEIIDVYDFAKTKNDMIRLKARVIGTKGKAWKTIENLCEVNISVYGKTLSIIGEALNSSMARKAIESLLSGSPHANVYKFLEKQRRDMKSPLL